MDKLQKKQEIFPKNRENKRILETLGNFFNNILIFPKIWKNLR